VNRIDSHLETQLPKRSATEEGTRQICVKKKFCKQLWAAGEEPSARQSKADVNLREGTEWLEANKQKEGVVTLTSGLQYKVITPGQGTIHPRKTDTVKVHYHGTLTDGDTFDSSYDRQQPAEFTVSGVIKGWTEALQLMVRGDVWELYVPGSLAYGEIGSGPNSKIGPNQVLVFKVELLEIRGRDPVSDSADAQTIADDLLKDDL